jgi:hypothetical protein
LDCTAPRSFAAALTVGVALCASACAVPLAPGYRIVKQSNEVRFVSGQPAQLQVRARYTLQNSGNSDLNFVDANLPGEKDFGRANVRVEVDGHESTPVSLPPEDREQQPNAIRIPFDSPWTRKKSHELSIEYAFSSSGNSGALIAIDQNSFHLGPRGWFPELQPPKRVLAPYPNPPVLTNYTVRVPADFLILAGGAPNGRKKDGGEIEYRFELRAGISAPYVVAGRYVASAPESRSHSAVFWTIRPLKDDPAPAAERITAAWQTLETDFGPLNKNITTPHIVESPGLRGRLAGESAPAAVAFPGGALVNPAALALGTGGDQFIDIVIHALARDWFGDEIYPSPEAAVGMGEGLPEYAAIVVDEARNGPDARRRRIVEYLRAYDDASSGAQEIPLGGTMMGDPIGQRRIALAKAPLFFAALEDTCGTVPMQNGIANLVARLRGREVGYADLRSALEESSNRNLAGMFRLWLNEKGIPEDFRTRYQGSAVGEVAEK